MATIYNADSKENADSLRKLINSLITGSYYSLYCRYFDDEQKSINNHLNGSKQYSGFRNTSLTNHVSYDLKDEFTEICSSFSKIKSTSFDEESEIELKHLFSRAISLICSSDSENRSKLIFSTFYYLLDEYINNKCLFSHDDLLRIYNEFLKLPSIYDSMIVPGYNSYILLNLECAQLDKNAYIIKLARKPSSLEKFINGYKESTYGNVNGFKLHEIIKPVLELNNPIISLEVTRILTCDDNIELFQETYSLLSDVIINKDNYSSFLTNDESYNYDEGFNMFANMCAHGINELRKNRKRALDFVYGYVNYQFMIYLHFINNDECVELRNEHINSLLNEDLTDKFFRDKTNAFISLIGCDACGKTDFQRNR